MQRKCQEEPKDNVRNHNVRPINVFGSHLARKVGTLLHQVLSFVRLASAVKGITALSAWTQVLIIMVRTHYAVA